MATSEWPHLPTCQVSWGWDIDYRCGSRSKFQMFDVGHKLLGGGLLLSECCSGCSRSTNPLIMWFREFRPFFVVFVCHLERTAPEFPSLPWVALTDVFSVQVYSQLPVQRLSGYSHEVDDTNSFLCDDPDLHMEETRVKRSLFFGGTPDEKNDVHSVFKVKSPWLATE